MIDEQYYLFYSAKSMSMNGHNQKPSFRKKKAQQLPKIKQKPNKIQIEQSFPIPVRPQRVPSEVKRLILDMQKQYIKRYNILINNRQVYSSIIESLSTELDDRAITPAVISQFASKLRVGEQGEDNTQAE